MLPPLVIEAPSSSTRKLRLSQLESFVTPTGICPSFCHAVTGTPPVVLVELVVVVVVEVVVEVEVVLVLVVGRVLTSKARSMDCPAYG